MLTQRNEIFKNPRLNKKFKRLSPKREQNENYFFNHEKMNHLLRREIHWKRKRLCTAELANREILLYQVCWFQLDLGTASSWILFEHLNFENEHFEKNGEGVYDAFIKYSLATAKWNEISCLKIGT